MANDETVDLNFLARQQTQILAELAQMRQQFAHGRCIWTRADDVGLCPAQLCRRDHFHGPRDLLRLRYAGNPAAYFT